jgi:uncharacterized protein YyaL (SSP411 family)
LDQSSGKKLEGAFYVWTQEEVVEVLGQQDAQLFCDVYGIKPSGEAISRNHCNHQLKDSTELHQWQDKLLVTCWSRL